MESLVRPNVLSSEEFEELKHKALKLHQKHFCCRQNQRYANVTECEGGNKILLKLMQAGNGTIENYEHSWTGWKKLLREKKSKDTEQDRDAMAKYMWRRMKKDPDIRKIITRYVWPNFFITPEVLDELLSGDLDPVWDNDESGYISGEVEESEDTPTDIENEQLDLSVEDLEVNLPPVILPDLILPSSYITCILQALFRQAEYCDTILQLPIRKLYGNSIQVIRAFQNIMQKMKRNEEMNEELFNLWHLRQGIDPRFEGDNNQDPLNYAMKLIAKINTPFENPHDDRRLMQNPLQDEMPNLAMPSQFLSSAVHEVECFTCGTRPGKSIKPQITKFSFKTDHSVQQSISEKFRSGGHKCDQCNQDFASYKTFFDKPPRIFIVQLKRFNQNGEKISSSGILCNQIVIVPVGKEQIGEKYVLNAIVCHQGLSIASGEYYTWIRNGDTWIKFENNEQMNIDIENEFDHSEAYLLFYAASKAEEDVTFPEPCAIETPETIANGTDTFYYQDDTFAVASDFAELQFPRWLLEAIVFQPVNKTKGLNQNLTPLRKNTASRMLSLLKSYANDTYERVVKNPIIFTIAQYEAVVRVLRTTRGLTLEEVKIEGDERNRRLITKPEWKKSLFWHTPKQIGQVMRNEIICNEPGCISLGRSHKYPKCIHHSDVDAFSVSVMRDENKPTTLYHAAARFSFRQGESLEKIKSIRQGVIKRGIHNTPSPKESSRDLLRRANFKETKPFQAPDTWQVARHARIYQSLTALQWLLLGGNPTFLYLNRAINIEKRLILEVKAKLEKRGIAITSAKRQATQLKIPLWLNNMIVSKDNPTEEEKIEIEKYPRVYIRHHASARYIGSTHTLRIAKPNEAGISAYEKATSSKMLYKDVIQLDNPENAYRLENIMIIAYYLGMMLRLTDKYHVDGLGPDYGGIVILNLQFNLTPIYAEEDLDALKYMFWYIFEHELIIKRNESQIKTGMLD